MNISIPPPSSKKIGALVFLISIGLANGSLFSQALNVKQFLKSALDDSYYKSFDLQNSFLQNQRSYSLPWLNEVQFRYQDNQFMDYRDRLAIRLDPGNPLQIYHNKKYFQGFRALKSLEQKMVLKEILRDRYEMIIEYWIASELAELSKKQKEIREQIGFALNQKAGSNDFDADQYLNAQLDIISKEVDWRESDFDRDVALTKIMGTVEATSFDLSTNDLIGIEQINQFVQSEIQSTNRTEFELMKQRVELSARKMKLEKSNFNIGYLQPMYSSDRRINGQSNFGVSFGVSIPITNSNKDNVAREKLNVIERQGELEQFQSEEKSKRLSSAIYLKLHLDHYQKLDSLITSVKNREMNLLTSLANNYDPVIELKYREKLIQLDVLKTRIKKEILIQYISFLDNSNKLHERPMLNYLSKDLGKIEE